MSQGSSDASAPHDLARRLLAHEGGDDRDPMRMAEATERACQKLHRQLVPVIGEGGFRAVMDYALMLTRREFSFLAAEPDMEHNPCLPGLRESVQGQDPARAAEALTTLLANFLAVTVDLLGRDLSSVFLRGAWPDVQIG